MGGCPNDTSPTAVGSALGALIFGNFHFETFSASLGPEALRRSDAALRSSFYQSWVDKVYSRGPLEHIIRNV